MSMFKKLVRRFLPGGGARLSLKVGDPAPEWECVDHTGERHGSRSLYGNRYLLFFYPKADTPGCTAQGKGFCSSYPSYESRGIQVFGVSFDTAEEIRAFAEKYGFPYRLLCDTERRMGQAFGTIAGEDTRYSARHTFLIGPEGDIELALDTSDPAGQAEEILRRLP
jgi:peroxiredoxin Q/BCP